MEVSDRDLKRLLAVLERLALAAEGIFAVLALPKSRGDGVYTSAEVNSAIRGLRRVVHKTISDLIALEDTSSRSKKVQ